MLGLMNRAIEAFLRDRWGPAVWARVIRHAGIGADGTGQDGIEAFVDPDTTLTPRLVDAAARATARTPDGLLEDLGTYLVSHPSRTALRRLLRFGGRNFTDFLLSLEDLPARARLALPDLKVPSLHLAEAGSGRFVLTIQGDVPGLGHAAMGLLRAMADDYGALVVIEHMGRSAQGCALSIQVLDTRFAEGRRFALAQPGA